MWPSAHNNERKMYNSISNFNFNHNSLKTLEKEILMMKQQHNSNTILKNFIVYPLSNTEPGNSVNIYNTTPGNMMKKKLIS